MLSSPASPPGSNSPAIALKAELCPGRRLAVVGGGFVGAEVASTARILGVDVTVIESGPTPFASTLGAEVGDVLARRYRAHGVVLRMNTTASSLPAQRVVLADGADG